jgi:hypothetical protein
MNKVTANKTLIRCGFLDCGHGCNRTYSDYPPEGTPIEKITYRIDDRRRSMLCSGCNRYTIYVLSQEEGMKALDKYKSK